MLHFLHSDVVSVAELFSPSLPSFSSPRVSSGIYADTTLRMPEGHWGFTAPGGCAGKHWALGQGQTSVLFWNKICLTSLPVNLLCKCRCISQWFYLSFIFRGCYFAFLIFICFFSLKSWNRSVPFSKLTLCGLYTLKCKLVPFCFFRVQVKVSKLFTCKKVALQKRSPCRMTELCYVIAWSCCDGWGGGQTLATLTRALLQFPHDTVTNKNAL